MSLLAYYAAFMPDDGKYSVFFPDLPGCTTWADTIEDAFTMAIEALEGHLEAMADDNDHIPPPSNYQAALQIVKKEIAEQNWSAEGVLLQLVPAPDVLEKPVRVNVSFRPYSLEMIDRKAKNIGMTRSGFLAAAASAYEIGQRV